MWQHQTTFPKCVLRGIYFEDPASFWPATAKRITLLQSSAVIQILTCKAPTLYLDRMSAYQKYEGTSAHPAPFCFFRFSLTLTTTHPLSLPSSYFFIFFINHRRFRVKLLTDTDTANLVSRWEVNCKDYYVTGVMFRNNGFTYNTAPC